MWALSSGAWRLIQRMISSQSWGVWNMFKGFMWCSLYEVVKVGWGLRRHPLLECSQLLGFERWLESDWALLRLRGPFLAVSHDVIH